MKQYPPPHTHNYQLAWPVGGTACKHSLVDSCGPVYSVAADDQMNAIGLAKDSVAPPVRLASANAKTRKVLLLQGPVGPFFTELQDALSSTGIAVRRVAFNAGDRFFVSNRNLIRFSGSMDQWKTWLKTEFVKNKPDCVILFGSSRPAHKIARRLADFFGMPVLSLEEGYLRAGFVTAEFGGNNQHSPLVTWKPQDQTRANLAKDHVTKQMRSSFLAMSFWGAIYYLARDLVSSKTDEDLFHRPRERVLPLAWSWCAHTLHRAVMRVIEARLRGRLIHNPGYIIVPLQVASDSQIQKAARGWTTRKLIDACLTALRETHPGQIVVFKLHPLERSNRKINQLIHQRARDLGVSEARFKVTHTGRISDLTRHATGMVVINSTSGFSALHHGVPLLVLGEAVFRHDAIATTGNSQKDITDFFKIRRARSPETVAQFFETIKSQSLLSGDFYLSAGRKEAIKNIIGKLDEISVASSIAREVIT